MAASVRTCIFRFLHPFLKNSSSASLIRTFRVYRHSALKKSLLLSFAPIAAVLADNSNKPFEPNDVRLRSSECLKNAAGLAVDSTSAVLSQTVYAIINVEKQYVEMLEVLVKLLEYQIQVLGKNAEEERIADIILETRHGINEIKIRKQDLALLFSSVEKLADAAAEVAFATGSSYASTSAGERLYSAQQEVTHVMAISEKAEKEVAYAEAEMITQLTRYEERTQAKKLKEDTITESTQPEELNVEEKEDENNEE